VAGGDRAGIRGRAARSRRPACGGGARSRPRGARRLLDGTFDELLPALPPPRRLALEVALLRRAGDPLDPRALAVAVRDALQLLAEREAVLVAVDDVQWLDRPSSRALAFALRRLPDVRLRVLLARRVADGLERSPLEQALPAGGLVRLPVGPLTVGALHRALRDGVGRPLAPQTRGRLHQRSGGNPV
jgi:hypothetical protein